MSRHTPILCVLLIIGAIVLAWRSRGGVWLPDGPCGEKAHLLPAIPDPETQPSGISGRLAR